MMYRSSTSEKHPKSLSSFFPLPSDELDEVEDTPKITSEQLERTLKLYGAKI